METLEQPKSFDSETNLEGKMEREKTGLSPEKLAEKELEKAGPYINKLVDRLKKEVEKEQKEIYGDNYSLSDMDSKELVEELIYKIENEIIKQTDGLKIKGDCTIKNFSENLLTNEAKGILEISGEHYPQMILDFAYAGIPEKGEKILNKLDFAEKEFTNKDIITSIKSHLFLMSYLKNDDIKKRKEVRKYVEEDILEGKSLNELDEMEIKKIEEIDKIWKRFTGYKKLSETEEERKRKKRVIGKWENIDREKRE